MITFPNCKINLGLNIVARRTDGYHDILTLFYPVNLTDILEIVPAQNGETTLNITGNAVDCPMEQNLVIRAYRLLQTEFNLPPVEIHLHKHIPDGAGLGGGSSDAAATLRILNEMFNLGLNEEQLATRAATLGADCPFFIYNRPMLASGIGDILTPAKLSLRGHTIVLAKPDINISTREAYAAITPAMPEHTPEQITAWPIQQWDGHLTNDFENSVFPLHPTLWQLKLNLLGAGAQYAAMSGSGSTIYGIFENDKLAQDAALTLTSCRTFVIPMT